MRVLPVDDSDVNRYTRNHVLTAAGFELLEASTGQEAHTLATQVKPDLILLDIRLPDVSGFEVCRQLRQSATTKDIPVILISAIGGEEHAYPQAVEHGAGSVSPGAG